MKLFGFNKNTNTSGTSGVSTIAASTVKSVNPTSPTLKIITLSGTESVTKNMTVYECGEDIIVVDCGVGFPDSEMYGVDVVIPDMSYLVQNASRVRGLFITHGHEDHIGAIPYFLKDIKVPIYANNLVQGFIKERLKDKSKTGKDPKEALEGVSFKLLTPETPEVVVGNFKISAFGVNHSVPSSMGFAIKTPQGTVLHMADYKIDWTPVLDKPIDIATISKYGEEGVLCLLSDCLGSTTEGYTKSENTLNNTFHEIFESAVDKQILVTTISSNISRMHQIIKAAIDYNRKVVLVGRSIDQNVAVARSLGYLNFPADVFIKEADCENYHQKDLVYIIAGCFGQQGSALDRVSRGEHDFIELEKEALVIFSADPNPPGVGQLVERMMDNLTLRGADVIYSKIQDNLHVSGHGTKGDLLEIAALVKPQYFIPIGGTITKARAYTKMVSILGVAKEQVFELLEGESVVFANGKAKKGDKLDLQPVMIDGSGAMGGVEPVVIRDREHLSNDGVFVVVVPLYKEKQLFGSAEIITRGFVYVKESRALIGKSADVINKVLDKHRGSIGDWGAVKNRIERDVEKFLYKQTGRSPLIIVHVIAM